MTLEGAMSTTTPVAGSDDIQARIEATLYPQEAETPNAEVSDTEETAAQETDTAVAEEQNTDAEEQDTEAEAEEQDTEAEAEEDASETDENEVSLEVSQFAQLLGADEDSLVVDEDGTVSFRTKVDGEVGKVKLQDLIRSYQTDAHVTRKSQALSEERKEFEAQVQQKAQEIQGRVADATAAIQLVEGQLTQEYQSIDWDGLKQADPARWSVLRQEFQDRVAAINSAKQKAQGALQAQMQEQQQQMELAREARLRQEAEALQAKLPEWRDPEVAQKQHKAMSGFLAANYGFDPNDINNVEDHRLILLAQDAMKYRQSLKAGEEAVKKVVNLPKLQKPGKQKVNTEAAAKKAAQTKKLVHLRKSGGKSTDALASLLVDRM